MGSRKGCSLATVRAVPSPLIAHVAGTLARGQTAREIMLNGQLKQRMHNAPGENCQKGRLPADLNDDYDYKFNSLAL